MNFIDHTGHIFSLPSYNTYPTGYEYNENPYVFWINDCYASNLSIDCFYLRPIRLVFKENVELDNLTINITINNSKNYKLLHPKKIQEKLNLDNPFSEEIELNFYTDSAIKYNKEKGIESDSDFDNKISISSDELIRNITNVKYFYKDENNREYFINDESQILKEDDNLYIVSDNKTYEVESFEENYAFTEFFILGCASEYGSWLTNVLIEANYGIYNEYCPITIGGSYTDECEELIINGQNIGLSLPKDILRSIYQSSFWNELPDLSLWNQKIKEYLLNLMKIRSECGNFRSAIESLKWFGFGNKISLSSLIQTDNKYMNQYICDNFDLTFDIINEYRYFRRATLLSLNIKGTIESEEVNQYDFDSEFWGEGKPKIEDLFSKEEVVKYDEADIEFRKPYYDWLFNELALKLSCLKYYYQKYFLPIHLYIHRASITNQVFANDIKQLNIDSNLISEYPLYASNNRILVKFPESSNCWLSAQRRIIDLNWIEDPQLSKNIIDNTSTENFFDIDDNCFFIPISFINNFDDEYIADCILYAYQDDILMKEAHFSLNISTEYNSENPYYLNFILYPKEVNKKFNINFWTDRDYKIILWCNGTWYEYHFKINIPELDIDMGKLEYKYDYNVCKQFSGFSVNTPQFNAHMYIPDIITINNINFVDDLIQYMRESNISTTTIGDIKEVLPNEVYYYYYNDAGEKTILSTSEYKLIWNNRTNEYVLKKNIYDNENLLDDILKNKIIYSNVHRNIDSFINLYSVSAQIPNNKKFFNKVYLFDIYEQLDNGTYTKLKYSYESFSSMWQSYLQGETENLILTEDNIYLLTDNIILQDTQYSYGGNDIEAVKDLYLNFFDENGDWNKDFWLFKNNRYTKSTTEQELFDFYLMHDHEYWYGIFISKNTIGDSSQELVMQDTYQSGNYTLSLNRSDEKFLINRMKFISSNGFNKFTTNDMIVSRLLNHANIPFKYSLGSKWEYMPLGIGNTYKNKFESPTNVGLMSIGDDVKVPTGYYEVKVNFSIDNYVNDSAERKTTILIE